MVDLSETVQILARTPRTLLSGLSDAWLLCTEGPDTFSPLDVLGHLIYGEETDWIPRLRIILERGPEQPFEPWDRFAFRTRRAGVDLAGRLDRFEELGPGTWRSWRRSACGRSSSASRARTPRWGRVTLGQLLASWVVHDLGHVRQVVRVMARRHREDVGPWRAYLSTLDQG